MLPGWSQGVYAVCSFSLNRERRGTSDNDRRKQWGEINFPSFVDLIGYADWAVSRQLPCAAWKRSCLFSSVEFQEASEACGSSLKTIILIAVIWD